MDDPRHVFFSASEVMARYGWGKTKGHQNLKDRELVPPPVMTHPIVGGSTSSSGGRRSAWHSPKRLWTRSLRPTASRRPSPTCSPNPSDDGGRRDGDPRNRGA